MMFSESFLSFNPDIQYILLVLHPRHKLQYFKTASWEEEWIEAAEEIVRDEFDQTYAFGMDVDETSQDVYMVCFSLFRLKMLMYGFSRMSQRTCLTTYLPSPRCPQLSSEGNSNIISAQIQNTSPMSSHGGMQGKQSILASTGWHSTT